MSDEQAEAYYDDLLGKGPGDPDMHKPLTVAELLEKLGETKQVANEFYKNYKQFKEQEDNLKAELMLKLSDAGLKSAKGEAFTASISETPTVVIKSETALLEWLKNAPDVEEDFYIGVKKTEFNTLAKQMLKETGELADGTELETRVSLAIRSNKKKETA